MNVVYCRRSDLEAMSREIISSCRKPDLFLMYMLLWILMVSSCDSRVTLTKLQETVNQLQSQQSK